MDFLHFPQVFTCEAHNCAVFGTFWLDFAQFSRSVAQRGLLIPGQLKTEIRAAKE